MEHLIKELLFHHLKLFIRHACIFTFNKADAFSVVTAPIFRNGNMPTILH